MSNETLQNTRDTRHIEVRHGAVFLLLTLQQYVYLIKDMMSLIVFFVFSIVSIVCLGSAVDREYCVHRQSKN